MVYGSLYPNGPRLWVTKHKLLTLIRSCDMIIEFRTLNLKMKIGGEVFLYLSVHDLPR